MHIKNQVDQIGVINTLDAATLWKVTKVHEFELIVTCCDNPKQWRSVKPDNFWVLVDFV